MLNLSLLRHLWPPFDSFDSASGVVVAQGQLGVNLQLVRTWIDRLLALPLGLMPKRYWQSVDLPVLSMATASAFLTLFIGFGFGISGYFGYLERLRNKVGILEISELQVAGKLPETAEVSAIPTGLAMTAPFAFALFTPLGLLATYLVVSSFLRLVASSTGEPFGDPLLTGLDALGRRTFTTQQQRTVRIAREKLEGTDEPDRRYDGEWAGLGGVDYVIVCARRKPGWVTGTWIITSDGWFTLGEPFDRPTPNGLRTVYPLTIQTTTLDVLRKGVSYELPPLRQRVAKPSAQPES